MIDNPFASNILYENDPEGFIIPYKLSGKNDTDMMMNKYSKLKKISRGYIVRLGIGFKY